MWVIYVFYAATFPMILADTPRFDDEVSCHAVAQQMNTERKFGNYLGVCGEVGKVKTRGVYYPK